MLHPRDWSNQLWYRRRSMALHALDTESLPDQIFGRLLGEIVAGEHPPGTALASERQLTAELGVNRHVVREALKRLEQVGLVQINQGGATRVLDFRRTAGLDLLALIAERAEALEGVLPLLGHGLEMRASIGADVARLAARRATGDERRAITEAAEALAGAGEDQVVADRRFWQLLLDAAGNLAYQLAFNSLIRAVDAIPDFHAGWLAAELTAGDHRRPIATAVAAGDADTAADAARAGLEPPEHLLTLLATDQRATA
jgi:DNA-binding FadR family transcriptional regulator